MSRDDNDVDKIILSMFIIKLLISISIVSAGPLQLKGAAKQNIGKKNSKLTKFENDEDTVSTLGPIPSAGSTLFAGLHFLLTCTDQPKPVRGKSFEKDNEMVSY